MSARSGVFPVAALLAAVLLLPACGGPVYRMETTPSFKRYEQVEGLKLITPDGVRVQARETDNYPRGDLPFWSDALKRHLLLRGHLLRSEDCFTTRQGLKGCTLDFLLPRGAEDWVMSETLFLHGDKVVLLEACGPFDRFEPVQQELRQALRSFEVGE